MKAEILTIGDELLRGEIVDSNKAFLSDRLLGLDILEVFDKGLRDLRRKRCFEGGVAKGSLGVFSHCTSHIAGSESLVELCLRNRIFLIERAVTSEISISALHLRTGRIELDPIVSGIDPCDQLPFSYKIAFADREFTERSVDPK